jgi:hypothetical protein
MNSKERAIGANIPVLATIAVALFVAIAFAAMTSASGSSSSVDTMTTAAASTSVSTSVTTSGQIQVLSVTGPTAPYNPGGPVVSMTLKNAGDTSITSLNASLAITSGINTGAVHSPYWFFFDVSSANPLLSGQTIQVSETLINAGFQTGASYPLTVYGMTADGTVFSYTVQVQLQPPAASSPTT